VRIPRLISAEMASLRLGVSLWTIGRMVDSGRLPAVLLKPQGIRFREADVDRLALALRGEGN
jgi:excisionase family DNA binding protein